jgi:hypothetical protein
MIYNSRLQVYPFWLDEELLLRLIDSVKDRLRHTPREDWSIALIRSHVVQDLPANHYISIRQPWCDAVITILINEGYLNH